MKLIPLLLALLPIVAVNAAAVPVPAAEADLAPRYSSPSPVEITASALKCRTCAGQNCAAVRQYPKGRVTVVRCTYDGWGKTDDNCYISLGYVNWIRPHGQYLDPPHCPKKARSVEADLEPELEDDADDGMEEDWEEDWEQELEQ
ncbi:hypothetical protein AJ80_03953 [Polytolypa hystricis UAMH7299]|uniref:Uncharacterized protein n=1 Tax=Polytolypa hystricis (strain UAMH7299) TaxID=1447883 RepID=A0A2B7YEZ6_POLH7|nr:hypothetical protein AJ80_03953 [Polytolypa hystricis UAMH7299]